MAAEFRLPGSGYEELVNIIVAYGTRDEASNPGDVGKLDAVHQSSVSRNNSFLAAIGVLRGEKEKLVTRQGRALALALGRRDEEEIQRNWRQIVSTSEFMQNVVSAVKLREGMLYPTVQAYIAHSAGQPRNKPVMTGAGTIVEILKAAGLLKEEDGELVATFDEEEPAEASANGAAAQKENGGLGASEIAATVATEGAAQEGPSVNIHVHVRCTAEEVEDLAPRLKVLLEELSGPTP